MTFTVARKAAISLAKKTQKDQLVCLKKGGYEIQTNNNKEGVMLGAALVSPTMQGFTVKFVEVSL